MAIRAEQLYQIRKEQLAMVLFHIGLTIAFLGSFNPWFMWPIATVYSILASMFLVASLLISKSCSKPVYTNGQFLVPLVLYTLLSYYMILTRDMKPNAYIANAFNLVVVMCLFRMNPKGIHSLCNALAKGLGGFIALSMLMFLLYIFGFPLPSRDAAFGDTYSYTNYYFFLIDDRAMFDIIPRFQSVFLEPGHLGTTAVLLLFTQMDRWKRWYNVSLLISALISFSLAAYGLLIPILFFRAWINRRQVVKKALALVFLLGGITVGSFIYNGGDNLLHDLIMLRLEIEDGQLAGDNRVTSSFQDDYESFLESDYIFFGKKRVAEFGDSGYRVFFYDHGLVGLLLLALFYVSSLAPVPWNSRVYLSVMIIGLLSFIIRGFPLQYSYYVPLYCISKAYMFMLSSPKAEPQQSASEYPLPSTGAMTAKHKKVLYILNGAFMGGATISLFNMVEGVMAQGIRAVIVIPRTERPTADFMAFIDSHHIPLYRATLAMSTCRKSSSLLSSVVALAACLRMLCRRIVSYYELLAIMRKEQPDIVHTNVGVIREGQRAAHHLKIPHVLHIREYQDLDFGWHIYPSQAAFETFARKSNAVITISSDLKDYFHLNGEPNVATIYNGICHRNAIRMIMPKKHYFFCASRLVPSKGYVDVIKAFSQFVRTHSDYSLYIAGSNDTGYQSELEALTLKWGCEDKVQFLGHRNDVAEWMSEARALIVGSHYEGFGRMTAEASFAGCLCIGRNTGGTKEILHATNGFTFLTTEELCQMMHHVADMPDSDYHERALVAQKAATSLYSIESNVEQTLTIYNQLTTHQQQP